MEGMDIGRDKVVTKTDGDFILFIERRDKQITCIDRTNGANDCNPFTLYIKDHRIMGNEQIFNFNFRREEKEDYFLGTLKENYAQRISNKAFFYPLRGMEESPESLSMEITGI